MISKIIIVYFVHFLYTCIERQGPQVAPILRYREISRATVNMYKEAISIAAPMCVYKETISTVAPIYVCIDRE